jgi:hypothetical protein
MAKQLLKERFQQLAGITPLYGNKLKEDEERLDLESMKFNIQQKVQSGIEFGQKEGIITKAEAEDLGAQAVGAGDEDSFTSNHLDTIHYIKSKGGKIFLKGGNSEGDFVYPDINLELVGSDIKWNVKFKDFKVAFDQFQSFKRKMQGK